VSTDKTPAEGLDIIGGIRESPTIDLVEDGTIVFASVQKVEKKKKKEPLIRQEC
jgi:hypothetical protein